MKRFLKALLCAMCILTLTFAAVMPAGLAEDLSENEEFEDDEGFGEEFGDEGDFADEDEATPDDEVNDPDSYQQEDPLPAMGGTVTCVGCTLQLIDEKGKATGEKLTTLEIPEGTSMEFVVKPALGKGKKLYAWVIDGVRYNFGKLPKKITFSGVSRSVNIEAITKKSEPTTLGSAPGGESRLVQAENAALYFINAKGKTKGDSFPDLLFSSPYTNTATGEEVTDGTVTLMVKAVIPKGQKQTGWIFGDLSLGFDTLSKTVTVTGLDHGITFQPRLKEVKTTKKTTKKTEKKDKPTGSYRVSTTGCTFSGGGYKGARHATVPAGTELTIKAEGKVRKWTVNGTVLGHTNSSFRIKVTRATTIKLN